MTRDVLIVGAGVGGLAAAWWLGHAGWRVTVVEQAPDLRLDGYMIGLSGPGHEVVRRMGLLPELTAVARRIGENVYHDRNGRVLLRLRYRDLLQGLEWITLARTDLAAALYRAVRDTTDFRFVTTLTGLEQDAGGVRATLSDGTRWTGDLLIGADGARSSLRQRLFGPDGPTACPLGYRAAAFQVPDRLGLGADFLSYAEPGRIAETYTLRDGMLATLYAWRSADSSFVAPPRRREVLRAAFAGGHPDTLRWIDELPDAAPLYLDSLTMIDRPSWSSGRALLLGDAAHCLTLISGQGAGMAMTSACILAEELDRADVPEALRRHEARLRPTICRLQDRSRSMAGWFIPDTRLSFALRNTVMRWAPRKLLARYFTSAARSEILMASSDPAGPAA